MTSAHTPPIPFTEPTPTLDVHVTVEQHRRLREVVHRVLVILDDYLCDEFGFSRKAKGRYADT